MTVKTEQVSNSGVTYRIVNDAPAWMHGGGLGIFSIEMKKMYGDCEAWIQVYPESGKSDNDYLRTYKELKKLLNS